MPSVRDMVRELQREMLAGEMPPGRAVYLLPKATALIGNVQDEIREADAQYSVVLLEQLKAHAKANRARIEAETSPEYRRKREAHDVAKLLEQIVMTLKTTVKYAEAEMRMSR